VTGQSLLDTMEVLNQELQLQPGEADVARGLLALNMAQDFFESEAAKRPAVLGSSSGTVNQTTSTETTTYPAGLLRLDSLWYIESGLPKWKLVNRRDSGGHRTGTSWLTGLVTTNSPGKPSAYWTNGSNIYWDPIPDTTNTVRWYGLQSAADITASGTFVYPDIVRLPIAVFATSVLKIGLGDEIQDLAKLAESTFGSVLDSLGNFNRDGAVPLSYTYNHQ
jgi:hypothetical protein